MFKNRINPVTDTSQRAYHLSANERHRVEQGCTDAMEGVSNAANSDADSRRNEELAASSANSANDGVPSSSKNVSNAEGDGGDDSNNNTSKVDSPATVSNALPAIFTGTLKINTREGYTQVLEVSFQPRIDADASNPSWIENVVTMERINVSSSRMTVPAADSQSNMARDGLDPQFIAELTTVTIGVSGGSCIGPRDFFPKHSEFFERRVVSNGSQWEVAVEGSAAPKGGIKYQRKVGVSDEMSKESVGL